MSQLRKALVVPLQNYKNDNLSNGRAIDSNIPSKTHDQHLLRLNKYLTDANRIKGIKLFDRMLVLNSMISWDSEGVVTINDKLISESDIALLVATAVSSRGRLLPPAIGFAEFADFIKGHIPQKLYGYELRRIYGVINFHNDYPMKRSSLQGEEEGCLEMKKICRGPITHFKTGPYIQRY
jgi:hypothetical protein